VVADAGSLTQSDEQLLLKSEQTYHIYRVGAKLEGNSCQNLKSVHWKPKKLVLMNEVGREEGTLSSEASVGLSKQLKS